MRLTDEHGFTMITTMLALFCVSILSVAAIAAANGDIRLARYDQDDKQAYAAAEAGINDYLAHLDQDSNYWAQCTGPTSPTPKPYPGVNQQFSGASPAGRKWRAVPGTTNSDYSIELIPRRTKKDPDDAAEQLPTACDPANPVDSMVDGGNITIRSTGRVAGKKKRAIVASYRRTGFLDYIYFTDLENQDPTYLDLNPLGTTETRSEGPGAAAWDGPTYRQWAADYCKRYRWAPGGRGSNPQWNGQVKYAGTWYDSPPRGTSIACGEITFASDDEVNGPFHSNDDIQLCGTPDFGRASRADKVEISGVRWHEQPNCASASPNFRPSLTTRAPQLGLPPSNGSIQQAADPAYLFAGATTLRVSGTDVTVTNAQRNGGNPYTTPLPPNGVIFVKNISCTYGYQPDDTDAQDPNCGTAKVSGNYNRDLTIATEDDIIVDGNLQRTSDASSFVLGLVAKNFVRVWHPVDGCTNRTGTPTNIRIDGAILSLAHSFTVDNYGCGAKLGDLTINGVIAQKHRGIVGTGGGSGTGYTKKYNYDDKLKYRSPPYFLDPVQSSWRIVRQTEQSPAR